MTDETESSGGGREVGEGEGEGEGEGDNWLAWQRIVVMSCKCLAKEKVMVA